ncbi:unnamed protein product [Prorocentrum cordatum]|uniref:Uncharacterized protein n=1 Tax=Prorocentrum cordatum TaxID=2364126 RepID=A0ABN9P6G8_9DINO|nr:unnamed protein product [Polarella glacialis]
MFTQIKPAPLEIARYDIWDNAALRRTEVCALGPTAARRAARGRRRNAALHAADLPPRGCERAADAEIAAAAAGPRLEAQEWASKVGQDDKQCVSMGSHVEASLNGFVEAVPMACAPVCRVLGDVGPAPGVWLPPVEVLASAFGDGLQTGLRSAAQLGSEDDGLRQCDRHAEPPGAADIREVAGRAAEDVVRLDRPGAGGRAESSIAGGSSAAAVPSAGKNLGPGAEAASAIGRKTYSGEVRHGSAGARTGRGQLWTPRPSRAPSSEPSADEGIHAEPVCADVPRADAVIEQVLTKAQQEACSVKMGLAQRWERHESKLLDQAIELFKQCCVQEAEQQRCEAAVSLEVLPRQGVNAESWCYAVHRPAAPFPDGMPTPSADVLRAKLPNFIKKVRVLGFTSCIHEAGTWKVHVAWRPP